MRAPNGQTAWSVGYEGECAQIELRQADTGQSMTPRDTDLYWKIGITLPDLMLAYEKLRRDGIEVSEPTQFQDIGFMCHLTDTAGFGIELLQHTFEDEALTQRGDAALPLGGGATLGQITLRVTDINAALEYYRETLGMTLLSVQPVASRDFTLYFLAFTRESPPLSALESVSNRPWLWQRPYTLLELQHLHKRPVIDRAAPGDAGFHGIKIVTTDEPHCQVVRSHHTGAKTHC